MILEIITGCVDMGRGDAETRPMKKKKIMEQTKQLRSRAGIECMLDW